MPKHSWPDDQATVREQAYRPWHLRQNFVALKTPAWLWSHLCQNGSALYCDADPLPSQMLWTCNVTCWWFNFQLYFYSTGDFANAKLMYSEFYDPWYCSLTRWRILRIQCNQRSVLSVLIEIHTHTGAILCSLRHLCVGNSHERTY